MKAIEPRVQGKEFTLGQVCLKFITEFKLPQSKKHALSELWKIQKREGEYPRSTARNLKMQLGD
jgi:hypothetical protein